MNPIELVDLRKVYGDFVAVDDLTLEIPRNSFTGLLGPNGAGKSTTLKILTSLIRATSGEAYLNGVDVTKRPQEALIGVGTVIETPEFYPYLTPRETFRYIGRLIGMSNEAISSETSEILEKVKMSSWADKRVGTFSKGMRQRIALGQALLNSPNIILLDEPTSGLDPRGMAEIREVLKGLRNDTRDLTIVMSSHILPEVQSLCDRVVFMNRGRKLMEEDVSALTVNGGIRTMVAKVDRPVSDELVSSIQSLEYVKFAERSGNEVHIAFEEGRRTDLFGDLAALDAGVYGLYENEVLESTYLDMIEESR